MSARVGLWVTVLVALPGLLAGCATPPPPPAAPVAVPIERPAASAALPAPVPLDQPPLEPVAPRSAPGRPSSVSPPAIQAPLEPLTEPPATPATTEPTDEQQLASVLVDLQRYAAMSPDEARREQNVVNQLIAKQRNDYNRIRLAVLLTLVKTPQDDQRAMQLLDSVIKSNPGAPTAKQLAAVVQVQVAERVRAVRDEQQKADAAQRKLEALRNMERDLLRDRIRSGGGGGGGGGSSGGSGGAGGGGGGGG
jgi:hypothetical protein